MDASPLAMTLTQEEERQAGYMVSVPPPVFIVGEKVLLVAGFVPPSAAQPFRLWVFWNGISKAMPGRCHGRLLRVAGTDCIAPDP
jgi:hypothetical protein